MIIRPLARLSDGPRRARALLHRTAEHAVDVALKRFLGETFENRLSRVPLALGPTGVDPFGLDPHWVRYVLVTLALLHRKYFRADVNGIEGVPRGRVLLVANHSGQLPIDGALIAAALFMDAEPPRFVRAVVGKCSVSLPFVSVLFSPPGQMAGLPAHAARLSVHSNAVRVS